MPVEFLGMAATNDGSETPRAPAPPSTRTTRSGWPAPTRTTAGTGCCSPTAPARPTPRRPRPTSRPAPRPLQILLAHRPNVSYPTFAAKTFATLDQISDGRLDGALHHRRQRPRAGPRGRLPHQGRALRPHPRVHPDRQAGLDHPRALRPRGRALPLPRLRQRRLPGPAAAPAGLVRRLVGRGVRGRRRRGRHLLPVGRAAGADRRADRVGARPPRRRPGRTDVPRIQVAFRPIIAPDRGAGLGEGPPHRRRGSRPARRAARSAAAIR